MKIITLITLFILAIYSSSFAQGYARTPVNFKELLNTSDAVVLASLELRDSERLSDDKNSFIHEDRYAIHVEKSFKGKVEDGSLLILPTHKLNEPNPHIIGGEIYVLFLRDISAPNPMAKIFESTYSLAGGWRGLVPTTGSGSDNRLVGIVYKMYGVDLIKDKDAFLEVIHAAAQQKPIKTLSEREQQLASALGFK